MGKCIAKEIREKAKPILFKPDMIKAILKGLKTQTRRIINPQPAPGFDQVFFSKEGELRIDYNGKCKCLRKARFKKDDILYIKEPWNTLSIFDTQKPSELDPRGINQIAYLIDGKKRSGKIRSALFMPKWVARIFLKIKRIWVDRIKNISEQDCIKEGIKPRRCSACGCIDSIIPLSPKSEFKNLWDSINKGPDSWECNPFVYCYEFEIIGRC